MKLLLLGALCATLNVFACMGGSYDLDNNVVLLGDSILVDGSKELATSDASLDEQMNIEGNNVTVLYVKSDFGGVIYTIYEADDKIIKVKTNYHGNGMRSRGMSVEPTFDIDEEVGC